MHDDDGGDDDGGDDDDGGGGDDDDDVTKLPVPSNHISTLENIVFSHKANC